MLDRYTPNFRNLTETQTAYLARAVQKRYPQFVAEEAGPYESGEELFHHCDSYGFDQADVVMSLASDPSPEAVAILEAMIGKELTREVKKAPTPAKVRASGPRPKVRKTDPRVIVEVAPNPKRAGTASHARYEHYVVGDTVTQAIEKGLTTGDISHDAGKGFIKLGDPE